ncbi:MAG: GTPase ObgE [Tissierellia bacterium]|nr:GTPase ObgE [Tissierellia bacterium]
MFIDIAKINLEAGKGGNGAVAFRREKYEPSGGPYGGDGGDGGDIILLADEGLRTLMDFRYKLHYKAESGEDGRTKRQFGKSGEDMILKVPVGTLVKDEDTGNLIVDMKSPGQTFVIARGGRGGKGNARFATATRQAPRFAQPGTRGEERKVVLELKLIADVGLIGFPNVGKSTILSILSEAKPKIANYHFTTLRPNLGVVSMGAGESFVIADIPGLIEGAHKGIGLGHDFLRHVERTKVLVHVLDASGLEGRDPLEDFHSINEELARYNPKLSEKPQIIAANKMDIPQAEERIEDIRRELETEGYRVFPVSAATTMGMDELRYGIYELLSKVEGDYDTFDDKVIITPEQPDEEAIIVRKEDGKFIVEGSFIERLLESTNFDNMDSLRYFQNVIREKGVEDELEDLGITEGDSVFVCGHEFEYFA